MTRFYAWFLILADDVNSILGLGAIMMDSRTERLAKEPVSLVCGHTDLIFGAVGQGLN